MLKKFIALSAAILLSFNCFSQTEGKVVVCDKGTIGRYISEDEKEYTASIQDFYKVEKSKAHIETYRAVDGKGWVLNPNQNKVNVRNAPSAKGKIIGTLFTHKGYLPDLYPCLGMDKGWMKIKYRKKTGFVRADLVKWEAINSN